MEYIDLVERLVPSPLTTVVVIETPNTLVLVDCARTPREGDTVMLQDNSLRVYPSITVPVGVAYCSIRFL